MSLFNDLSSIYTIKQQIKAALESKGVSMLYRSFPDYPAAISEISSGGSTSALYVTENGEYYPANYNCDAFDYVSVSVAGGGGGYSLADICQRLYVPQVLSDPDITNIGYGVFGYTDDILEIDLPNCEVIGSAAFKGCTGFSSVSLPAVTTIEEEAFYECTELETVYIPECKNIYTNAFARCTVLSDITCPKLENIGPGAFGECDSLTQISIPNCSTVENMAFYLCPLSEVELPECKSIGQGAFQQTSLESISLPKCSFIDMEAFAVCYSLSEAYLPICDYLGQNAFIDTALESLTLGIGTYIIPTYFDGVIDNTPLQGGAGSIYVDAAMYNSYLTAPGWSNYSSQIVSVGNTDPMLSFDINTGLVYGKTWVVYDGVNTHFGVLTTNITGVSLSSCIEVGAEAFISCINLSYVSLPNCEYIGPSAFRNCASISSVELPKCSFLASRAFRATGLATLVLGYSEMIPGLYDALSGTAITNTSSGSIYVLSSLVSIYEDYYNQTSLHGKFVSIPE